MEQQERQLQLINKQLPTIIEKLGRNSTSSIITALVVQDKMGVSLALKKYKTSAGAANFPSLLRIPSKNRIPELIKQFGVQGIHLLLAIAVQSAMENLNFVNKLTASQVFELVDILIDSSEEDYLSLEDIMIFLQKFVRGEMGELFNTLDIPKFMKFFEDFRQERHSSLLKIREEQHAQYKVMGGSNFKSNIEIDRNVDPASFFDMLNTYNEQKKEVREKDASDGN